jgi:alkanesulfonate monooxygenase SsuD/methylene tetrahydromethanopterin reductase-like flavin-dependent oxidoreductase (luciferase family)
MSRQVTFGLGLYTGQQDAASSGRYRDAITLARAAEAAGFDAFWVSEHHGLDDGYLPSPLTLLAAVASSTERITLGTGIVIAPLHHPLRIAEDAVVVDHLSGGRLVLGLGLGYVDHEFRMFDSKWSRRVRASTRPSKCCASRGLAIRSRSMGARCRSPMCG